MILFFWKNKICAKNDRTSRPSFSSQYAFFFFFALLAQSNCDVTKTSVFSASTENDLGTVPVLSSVEVKMYYEGKWMPYQPPASETLRKDFVFLAESGKLSELISASNAKEKRSRKKRDTTSTKSVEGRLLFLIEFSFARAFYVN